MTAAGLGRRFAIAKTLRNRSAAVVVLVGCGGASPTGTATTRPDVRQARDRPPVILVAREGDPASAVSMSVLTGDDPLASTALAALFEARLPRARVTPSWDGVRVTMVASTAGEATAAVEAMRVALLTPVRADEPSRTKTKVLALAATPMRDPSLTTWARCTGAVLSIPGRPLEVTLPQLDGWRAASVSRGRVAFAVAGSAEAGEAVARAIGDAPAWSADAAVPTEHRTGAVVYEAPGDGVKMRIALEVGSSSAAVATAKTLGDARGPLRTRLDALEIPFRLREIVGAAHADGGCVGVTLDAVDARRRADLAARAADAIALVIVEAHLAGGTPVLDGRTLARRAGDSREAAELASWWALADRTTGAGAFVALEVPSQRGGIDGPVDPSSEALNAAIEKARLTWQRPVVEGRVKVEPGQGEAWVLLASPCGTDSEGELDAGVTALAIASASIDAEPFVAPDGAGLLVHGPALAGESATSHAQRLSDLVARAFTGALVFPHGRVEGAVRDDDVGALLASVLAPGHPSWVTPWGASASTMRIGDGAISVRAQALRNGPLRLAVLANVDRAQGDAAVRAADRWIDRHGDAVRECTAVPAIPSPKPGTYAVETHAGALPEAVLAFPVPSGEENAARAMALALDGNDGLLQKSLGDLAAATSARVLGAPRSTALVIRIASSQASLDGAVLQARALLGKLHREGLGEDDMARAASALLTHLLDPRARVIATWRGAATKSANADDIRAFARNSLGEDRMLIVAARPPRPKP